MHPRGVLHLNVLQSGARENGSGHLQTKRMPIGGASHQISGGTHQPKKTPAYRRCLPHASGRHLAANQRL